MLYVMATDLCKEKFKFDAFSQNVRGDLRNHWTQIVLAFECLFHAESKYGYENLNFKKFWKK